MNGARQMFVQSNSVYGLRDTVGCIAGWYEYGGDNRRYKRVLAVNDDEWVEKLLVLIRHEALRQRLAMAARMDVETKCALQVLPSLWYRSIMSEDAG